MIMAFALLLAVATPVMVMAVTEDYRTNIDRVIYIRDVLYTLAESKIVSYDLNTFEKLNEVVLKEDYDEKNYEYEIMYDAVIE